MHRFLATLLSVVILLGGIITAAGARAASPSRWQVLAPVRTPPVLYAPSAITLDAAGRMYVTDAATGLVTELSTFGKLVDSWGVTGAGQNRVAQPSGIARDRRGNLYIANPGLGKVFVLSPGGRLVRSWVVPRLPTKTQSVQIGSSGNYLTLTSQLAITVGPSGNVLTVQPSGQTQFTVRRFSPTGTQIGVETIAIHTPINTTFPGMQGLAYIVTPLGISVASNGAQFLSLEEQVCSISRNNQCRAYQILHERSTAGYFAGEWLVSQKVVGPKQSTGLAMDHSGRVLVPGPQDNAVYVYSQQGKRLQTWKPRGAGVGDFSDIGGIAVSPSGNVLLTGLQDRTIQRLSSGGARLAIWDKTQSDTFYFPSQLALDKTGDVYVVQMLGKHIKKLRPNGTTAASWYDPDEPAAVAIGPNGSVYVADALRGVRQYSSAGKLLRQWGSVGIGSGQFRGPHGIAVDKSGNVYVADTFNQRIEKFTASGKFLKQWGGRGTSPGQFEDPQGITMSPSGKLYVADTDGIREFGLGGKYIASFQVPRAPWDPESLPTYPDSVAVDAAGHIFTAYDYDAVVEIVPGGTPRFWGGRGVLPGQFAAVSGVALDRSGAVYITDTQPYVRDSRVEKLATP